MSNKTKIKNDSDDNNELKSKNPINKIVNKRRLSKRRGRFRTIPKYNRKKKIKTTELRKVKKNTLYKRAKRHYRKVGLLLRFGTSRGLLTKIIEEKVEKLKKEGLLLKNNKLKIGSDAVHYFTGVHNHLLDKTFNLGARFTTNSDRSTIQKKDIEMATQILKKK